MRWHPFLALVIFAASGPIASAVPVTKAQLLSMANEKVNSRVMRAIVERDCVDFDVDATNAGELSRALPPEVLEAVIACRKSAGAAPPPPDSPPAESPTASPSIAAPAPVAAAVATPLTGQAELRVRAVFIGESAALTCSCVLDGNPIATLTKEEQGMFGEAVARSKIGRQSGYIPLAAGRHEVLFRCDPRGQEVSVHLDAKPGERQTVEVAETTFRHWKLRRVEKK